MVDKPDLKCDMPEYELKKLLCGCGVFLALKGFTSCEYFSASVRCGVSDIWMIDTGKYQEFLTPDKLSKISLKIGSNFRQKELGHMASFHKSIYQGFPEVKSLITAAPAYLQYLVQTKVYSNLPEIGKYGGDLTLPDGCHCYLEGDKFLVAAGHTPQGAYQAVKELEQDMQNHIVDHFMKKEDKMVSQISEREIEDIVSAVMKNVAPLMSEQPAKEQSVPPKSNSIYGAAGTRTLVHTGKKGVFKRTEDAVAAADAAQKDFVHHYKMEDRERIIRQIRKTVAGHREELARLNIEETKLGRYEDKVAKIDLVVEKTPGTEILTTYAKSGDDGLMIEEMGPYGVIGAVSPVTNPTETLICNAIGMIAAGNAAVYNVHPSGKNVSAYTVDLINQAVIEAKGPENLITMVEDPTMDTLQEIIKNPAVKLLCGTGGPGLVRTLLSSGKKAIGAGAGNPPVVVDETADTALAAREILKGAAFENNILCIAEKEVFVVDSAADELIYQMMKQGAYMLNKKEVKDITRLALYEDEKAVTCGCSGSVTGKYHINKKWVGKDATMFLEGIGVKAEKDVRLLIFETEFGNPFVQLEQMMPILPIVRVKSLEEAMTLAVEAEHGNRHTASMFSESVSNLTEFAKRIETTIFVKNACTMAGVGFAGEGYTTFTIAGPTGEGITSAKTFTRVRRCVLAEGGMRVI